MTGTNPVRHGELAAAAKRVLLVTSYYSALRTSVETGRLDPTGMPAVVELWRGLRRAGILFDHLLIDNGASQRDVTPRAMGGFSAQFVVVDAPTHPTALKIVDLGWRAWQVLRAVRRSTYDVVYLDREHLVEGALIALGLPVRVVLRLHGVARLPETLESPGYNVLRWVRRFALRAPFDLIVSSQDGTAAESFLARAGSPAVPKRIWLNGVSGSRVTSADCTEAHPPTVLFLGRLAEYKGVALFLDVIKEMSQRRRDFRALVVGSGPLLPVVQRAAGQVPLLEWRAPVRQVDVGRLYSSAAVYVSLNGLGNLNNTVLEALKAGACIVTFGRSESGRDDATERLLGDAVCFVSPDSAPAELVDVLEGLLDSRTRRHSYRKRAAAVADRLLETWPERIDREVDLLARLARGERLSQ